MPTRITFQVDTASTFAAGEKAASPVGIVKLNGDHLVILRRGRLFTVRVGAGDGSAASYFIPDHEAIVELLDLLIDCLPGSRRHGPGSRIRA